MNCAKLTNKVPMRAIFALLLCIVLVSTLVLPSFASPSYDDTITALYGRLTLLSITLLANNVRSQYDLSYFDRYTLNQLYSTSFIYTYQPVCLFEIRNEERGSTTYAVLFASQSQTSGSITLSWSLETPRVITSSGVTEWFYSYYRFASSDADYNGGYSLVHGRETANVFNLPGNALYFYGSYGLSSGLVEGIDDYVGTLSPAGLTHYSDALDAYNGLTYQQGANDGYANGYSFGYTAGDSAGYTRGYTAGDSAGYTRGYDVGYDLGYDAGINVVADSAYDRGYDAGKVVGYRNGVDAGKELGYKNGYTAGQANGSPVQFEWASLIDSIPEAAMRFFSFGDPTDPDYRPLELFGINVGGLLATLLIVTSVILVIKLVKGRGGDD